ncbi:Inositol polyphosphate multikinase [Geodia barretti]|uniref:Kinase n=1 Tax=Geodia barretti TaxID=519541 RepID=A0AA35TEU7_GEOBA|nr:Inositol polyphosphate multikinase [Geodia barretti]
MALVSAGGMGEAVLGYGDDGIASETARDVGRLTSGAKEIRLVAGLQQPEHEDKEGRRGRGVRVLMGEPDAGDGDANRREVGRLVQHHLLNVGLDSDLISKAARLANGSAAHPDSAEGKPDLPLANGVTAEKGGSHASNPGSPDQLVEMAIKCLDDKVDRGNLTLEALELLRLVPEGYIPLPHQVGGHRHVDGKLGFLRRKGQEDILYKPVQPGIKGTIEVQFYETLFGEEDLPGEVVALRQLVPGYYHKETIRDRAGNLHEFLKLEDITHRYKKPCILDVKVGRRVWDDFAEKDKIDREKKKYPAQETLGYRIIGMRVNQRDLSYT